MKRIKELEANGLSPRVRGSRAVAGSNTDGSNPRECGARGASRSWSIPASAGQPIAGGIDGFLYRVYPRECGAADSTVAWS